MARDRDIFAREGGIEDAIGRRTVVSFRTRVVRVIEWRARWIVTDQPDNRRGTSEPRCTRWKLRKLRPCVPLSLFSRQRLFRSRDFFLTSDFWESSLAQIVSNCATKVEKQKKKEEERNKKRKVSRSICTVQRIPSRGGEEESPVRGRGLLNDSSNESEARSVRGERWREEQSRTNRDSNCAREEAERTRSEKRKEKTVTSHCQDQQILPP